MKKNARPPAYLQAGGSLMSPAPRTIRAVIYTRKSVTMGLEQDYNSLAAQEDSCRAYIAAQAVNGWVESGVYSDGGFSGGNMERPEMKRLLADITARKVDIVVIYKIDRLSRSLRDFMNLQDTFAKYSVSFVSVTQQIDTSTAAGRMLLGVLASFAEFEREIIRERIRDKFASSLRQGLWIGGSVPYGYRVVEHKLVVDEDRAAHVRQLFDWYLACGSTSQVAEKMNQAGFRKGEKDWRPTSVMTALRNVRYVGDCRCSDGKVVTGQQPAIIERRVFDQVQQKIAALAASGGKGRPRMQHNALLAGRAFCGNCNCALTRKWSTRKANATTMYGYYVCSRNSKLAVRSCTVKSIPATLLEGEVQKVVERLLRGSLELAAIAARRAEIPQMTLIAALRSPGLLWQELEPAQQYALVRALLVRATVYPTTIDLIFDTAELGALVNVLAEIGEVKADRSLFVSVPIQTRCVSGTRRVAAPAAPEGEPPARTPEEVVKNPLLTMLARGYGFLDMFDRGEVQTVSDISRKVHMDDHLVMKAIRLATISPTIQRAIINGQEPTGLSIAKIRALKTEDWSAQERILGFA